MKYELAYVVMKNDHYLMSADVPINRSYKLVDYQADYTTDKSKAATFTSYLTAEAVAELFEASVVKFEVTE